jgi:hypothetical protein
VKFINLPQTDKARVAFFDTSYHSICDNTFNHLTADRGYRSYLTADWGHELDWGKAKDILDEYIVIEQTGKKRATGSIVLDYGNAVVRLIVRTTDLTFNSAGVSEQAVRDAYDRVLAAIPEREEVIDKVNLDFWMRTEDGPASYNRQVKVPSWDEVRGNYVPDVLEELDWLMQRKASDELRNGRLILWRGLPGTGKTYALRALAREWRTWADFHYVTDPEAFFGHSNYMMQVVLDAPQDDRCLVLVLEDSGELLRPTAKTDTGQGLSRLLNIVDGLLGQGLNLLVLVTTNEELKSLHPAIQRNGRCASNLEFQAFDSQQAEAWLAEQGVDVDLHGHFTVSELYAKTRGEEIPGEKKTAVGFTVA